MSYLRTPCFLVFFVWLSLCHCRHVCREMLLGSGVILVGKGPSILTPQTLSAVPAASALESLTSVRAPANAGGRCVGFSCSCMSMNAFKDFLPAAPFGWQKLCGKQWVFKKKAGVVHKRTHDGKADQMHTTQCRFYCDLGAFMIELFLLVSLKLLDEPIDPSTPVLCKVLFASLSWKWSWRLC